MVATPSDVASLSVGCRGQANIAKRTMDAAEATKA